MYADRFQLQVLTCNRSTFQLFLVCEPPSSREGSTAKAAGFPYDANVRDRITAGAAQFGLGHSEHHHPQQNELGPWHAAPIRYDNACGLRAREPCSRSRHHMHPPRFVASVNVGGPRNK